MLGSICLILVDVQQNVLLIYIYKQDHYDLNCWAVTSRNYHFSYCMVQNVIEKVGLTAVK